MRGRQSRTITMAFCACWGVAAGLAPAPTWGSLDPSGETPTVVREDTSGGGCTTPFNSVAPRVARCDHGGEGAESCETKWVVNVSGWGSVSGCGVSCNNGYYACCVDPTFWNLASCTCEPEPPRGPWTPVDEVK